MAVQTRAIESPKVAGMSRKDLLITLVIIHNVFAATNDVAIDSLAVNALREDERGQGNGQGCHEGALPGPGRSQPDRRPAAPPLERLRRVPR